jgi:hypothetical protein
MWNKTFKALVYYILEIIPYFLHTTAVACPYWEIFAEEGLQA